MSQEMTKIFIYFYIKSLKILILTLFKNEFPLNKLNDVDFNKLCNTVFEVETVFD